MSPSNRGDEILDFHYGVLKSAKTSIRLAQVFPGSGNKGVAITLIDAFITGAGREQYDALSYTWGDVARTKSITCNGKRLAVTPTLLDALRRFRDPDHVITLWIDQICICQDRIRERNQQVQMMGDIFKSARKVIVWLGGDYDDSRAGMQLAKQLLHVARETDTKILGPGELELHGLPKLGNKHWKALTAILKRPWFWRTWIIQEVVLNPRVEFVLGTNTLTWDDLESIVALLEGGPIPITGQPDQTVSPSELPFSRINRIRLRHRRAINAARTPVHIDGQVHASLIGGLEDLDIGGSEDDPELLDLLLISRGLGATDPRDKVYALLGLGKHDINPDYSMSPESVFTDFALQTLGIVTSIREQREKAGCELSANDREVRRAMVLLACAGTQNQRLPGLQSWVPDWTMNLSSRPLVFGLAHSANERFTAGGSKLGVFDWDCDAGLQLSGILLDTVHVAGSVFLDSDVRGDAHDLIAKWWREAQQIGLERIARSPGSTTHTDALEALRRRLAICKHGYYIGELKQKRRASLLDGVQAGAPDTAHSASQTLTLGPARGRVMFASTTGFLGLAAYGTQEGDQVVIIRGVDVPFILRPHGETYELIGEAYVQGVMDGEALEMANLVQLDVMIR